MSINSLNRGNSLSRITRGYTAAASDMSATGGIISDFTQNGVNYRAHIFTSSGTLSVTSLASNTNSPLSISYSPTKSKVIGQTIIGSTEYLIVAGGGGGRNYGGGGGGGLLNSTSPIAVSSYTITVGGGQAAGPSVNLPVTRGTPSFALGFEAIGGGDGGADTVPLFYVPGHPGGSGGGAGFRGSFALGGSGILGQGYPGGNSAPPSFYGGGGGGGAGGAGEPAIKAPDRGGNGGNGLPISWMPNTTGTPGPAPGRWFAGGGAGGAWPGEGPVGINTAGAGGGGNAGAANYSPTPGVYSTGGGGGGIGTVFSSGGPGIVAIRYQIGQLTATAKATGGAISYYGGKTIHTFTSSGTFATAPNWTATNVEYVVVGGGGGGATNYGGGGGAGGYRTGTTPIGAHPVSTTIQVGAGGLQSSGNVITANGTPSYFGTPITAAGGGTGGPDSIGGPGSGADAGNSGGSGGGHGLDGPGTPAAGNTPPTSPPQGNPGGTGCRGCISPIGAGGGGGGAGGSGAPAATGGLGGPGVQVPSTFLNPQSLIGTPGPNPGGGYFAGGGSSGHPSYPVQSGPNPGGGGYQTSYPAGIAVGGLENTGGGGGGAFQAPAGHGGSGIVLIAYPS